VEVGSARVRYTSVVSCRAALEALDEAALKAAVVAEEAARGVIITVDDVTVSAICTVVQVPVPSEAAHRRLQTTAAVVEVLITITIDLSGVDADVTLAAGTLLAGILSDNPAIVGLAFVLSGLPVSQLSSGAG
jgi:hypothetical protein